MACNLLAMASNLIASNSDGLQANGWVEEAKQSILTRYDQSYLEQEATRGSWPYYWEQEATRNKVHVNKKLVVAKTLLGAPGLTTRSKDATNSYLGISWARITRTPDGPADGRSEELGHGGTWGCG